MLRVDTARERRRVPKLFDIPPCESRVMATPQQIEERRVLKPKIHLLDRVVGARGTAADALAYAKAYALINGTVSASD